MTERINELKALIEKLAAESPLRRQLQEALDTENARVKEATEDTAENDAGNSEGETVEDAAPEESRSTLDNLKELNERLEKQLRDMEESDPSSLTGKLEKLMEDDEFITAAAGFLLGAVTVGAGALAVSLLKK